MIQSVMIDQREPEWVQRLKFGSAPVAVTLLDCGDLWVATSDGALLIVERKTPDDLLNSISDGRLFTQAASMIAQSPWVYIVVTGTLIPNGNGKLTLNHRDSGWDYGAVQGALLTVQEMGVRVVYVQGDADFAGAVERLAKRDRAEVIIRPARQAQILSPGAQVLSALPGIGLERALEIMRHFPNAAFALSYLTDPQWEGESVPGIAGGTKASVRRALGLTEDLKLYPVPIGD